MPQSYSKPAPQREAEEGMTEEKDVGLQETWSWTLRSLEPTAVLTYLP